MSEVAFEIEDLTAGYGGKAPAVTGVSLAVRAGEILALLGPNGAGKTTTLRSGTGLLRPMSGEVRLFGRAIRGRRIDQVARDGLVLVPQDRGIFFDLTVAEHLRLATRRGRSDAARRALETFPALEKLLGRRCGLLSGGEQQMVALAKALTAEPRVLLVDEMSMGLAPIIVQELMVTLSRAARDQGLAVVLVEQHTNLVLRYADQALVLNHGVVTDRDSAAAFTGDAQRLEHAYFGSRA